MEEHGWMTDTQIIVSAYLNPFVAQLCLLPLGETTVLEQVAARCRAAWPCARVSVLTPAKPAYLGVSRLCERAGLKVHSCEGSELDGLLETAWTEQAEITALVRCSQPLVDPGMLKAAVSYLDESGMDCSTVQQLPAGTAATAFSLEALSLAHFEYGADPKANSSVLLNRDRFECAALPAPPRLSTPYINLEIECEGDYWLLKHLYETLELDENGVLKLDAAIGYLRAHPDAYFEHSGGYAVVREDAA